MAKSIRSKIKKRLRTAKRQRVDAMVLTPQTLKQNEALKRTMEGRSVTMMRPKNAFKYPNASDSVFPQHEVLKPIDFRCQSLPMAGFAFRGNRRKYDPEEAKMMHQISISHPQMETLAGGGVVHAKTGKHISKDEAEMIATTVQRPEAAKVAMSSGQYSAADAVEEAIAMENAKTEQVAEPAEVPEPTNAADHSRRPLVKDARRAQRTAEHRPRANAVKKKGGASGSTAKQSANAGPAVPASTAADAKPMDDDSDSDEEVATKRSGDATKKGVKKKGGKKKVKGKAKAKGGDDMEED